MTDAREVYVCKLYQPDTDIVRLTELRWWMFRRKQAESQKLQPSRAAFLEGVKRAHYQCIIWKSAPDPNPDIPMPDKYAWKRVCDKYIPVMTTLSPARVNLLQMIKCGCSKCIHANNLDVSAKLTIYIVRICVAVEQKRTNVKYCQ